MRIFTWTCKIAAFCVMDYYLRETFDTIELPNANAQIQIYPDNCLVSFWVGSQTDDGELNGENDFSFEMNWCPVCGRKVGY